MFHQTPERWGSNIISLMWRFVLDSWSIRNNIEHGMDTDPIQVRKMKLIKKIMWQKEKIGYFPNQSTVTEEQLNCLPLDNIIMTESQIKLLIRASGLKATDVDDDKD